MINEIDKSEFTPDEEMIENWFNMLLNDNHISSTNELTKEIIDNEIEEIKGTIRNEHLWELGYNGDEPINPHTLNIVNLQKYFDNLTNLRKTIVNK